MGKKNANSKITDPASSDGAVSRMAQNSAAPREPLPGPAPDQVKGDALRTVEQAVARTKQPAKPATAKKVASSGSGQRAGGLRKAANPVPAFTPDDVALRAYFIAEKRRALGLPGDEHQDWIQAEQQLIGESRRSKKARRSP